ncbi:D-xylose-proton symporter-like 3, chloroplastic isoform X2 [Cryptomeria japonica]|uniref:D-xylose-proton symporter-like 3, chloroplastic isoform X2 n=1 Tax=Cryptomeria japonica TaxID=3369 RepID=UPI0027DAA9C3|nr:D-xylose-proton symporter-like 3, chloroplastic isoform X2 [Cryptomeria japonica]
MAVAAISTVPFQSLLIPLQTRDISLRSQNRRSGLQAQKRSAVRGLIMATAKINTDEDLLRSSQSGFSVFNWVRQRKLQVKANSAGSDIEGTRQPLIAPVETKEVFTWSSLILPFLFPALGGLLFGYDIGATSGASVSLQSAELSGTTWYNLSSIQAGLVVSGSLYGALCGSIIAFNVADFLGRRRELIVASVLYLLGAFTTALAPDLPVLIAGRLLYGLAIGLAMHSAPLYIAETAPSTVRGRLVSLKELFIVLGILLGYLVGNLEIDVIGGWRYMYGSSAGIALIMGVGMWWLPPSPRWLLLQAVQGKGNLQELKERAISALNKLRGRTAADVTSDGELEETYNSLQYALQGQDREANFWEIFQGSSLKAFTIGGGLVLFQQITGQPSVLYYAASILQSAGFSAASDATRVSVILGVFKTVSLLLLAAYYNFLSGASIVAVLALLLYVGSYQVSFGPISWLMVSEIFPLRTRGRGISVAVLVNFASNALVTFSFSPLRELLGPSLLFASFGIISLLSLWFVTFYVPETKGLSLEEIESQILK